MRTFDVYKHPTKGYEAVKQGFSWPAFFFTIIWTFVKRLWGHGLAIMGILMVLIIMETAFTESRNEGAAMLALLGQFGLFAVAGFNGNDWRRRNLAKRGYLRVASVSGETPDSAVGQLASGAA
jgi:hypothetical protein